MDSILSPWRFGQKGTVFNCSGGGVGGGHPSILNNALDHDEIPELKNYLTNLEWITSLLYLKEL